MFDTMDAEDGVTATAGGEGESADAASSNGGAAAGCAGGGSAGQGGDAANGGPATAERKGPHCMMRLVGIVVEDEVRPLLIDSRLQANRSQLDASAVGSRSEVWQLAARRFRDPEYQ
ncbi:unnamed protein product, partial [Pylaiella littoralis]